MALNLNSAKKGDYYSRTLMIILLSIDFLSFIYASSILEFLSPYITTQYLASHTFICALAWLITASYYQLFAHHNLKSVSTIFYKYLEALPLSVFIQTCSFALLNIGIDDLIPILALNLCALTLSLSTKALLLFLYRRLRQRHKTRYVIVGYSTAGKRLYQYLQQHKRFSYQFLGFYDEHHIHHALVAGRIEDVYQFCIQNKVHQIYLAINNCPALIENLSKFADNHYIYFGYVHRSKSVTGKFVSSTQYTSGSFIYCQL